MVRVSKKQFSTGLAVVLIVLSLVVGCALGLVGGFTADALTYKSDEAPAVHVDGVLQVHFVELGNKYTGDCTYIKAGDTDILIDAGSRTDSVTAISEYINQYVTDGKLEYVIVTHAHQDHYAGFTKRDGSIFDLYECGVIIDFALTNQSATATMYQNYLAERQDEIDAGATHYTAAECITQHHDTFDLGSGVTMKILDSYYYYNNSSTENDYSVCTLFTCGEDNYLFTGDLEAAGEAKLVEMNPGLPEVTLYKAGHHGSKTSSSDALLSVIKPEIVCVCCCCGSPEYTKTDANQFPTQQFVDRIAPYTEKVYVTTLCIDYDAGKFEPMNGCIVVATDGHGSAVTCANSDKVLKEWDWFKQHRTCPAQWK